MEAQFWNERYRSRDQLFSDNPNGALVTEVTDLPAGHALDVGSGEGADALWLARRGWQVTAVDISQIALDRAAAATSAELADRIRWTHCDLITAPPPAGMFDLVSAQYFPFPRQPHPTAPRGLLAAVAPGGTLLVVSHDLADLPPDNERGIDPSDYYRPDEITGFLDDTWTVLVNETRPRTTPAPPGTNHTHDTVLRARRSR